MLRLITLNDTHTHTHGRTALDEGSARRLGLCIYNIHYAEETDIRSSGGIRTRNPASERPLAFDLYFILCSGFYRAACMANCNSEVIPKNVSRAILDRSREFVNPSWRLHRHLSVYQLRNKRTPKAVCPRVERPCCDADHSATSSEEVRMPFYGLMLN